MWNVSLQITFTASSNDANISRTLTLWLLAWTVVFTEALANIELKTRSRFSGIAALH